MIKFIKKNILVISGVLLVLTLIVGHPSNKKQSPNDMANTSVTITRLDGRSGGSGAIISSNNQESKLLTNAHVCKILASGGMVKGENQTASVAYYQVSNIHDLCLVTVNQDFKVNTAVANNSPELYSESIAVGHPGLLPVILTRGQFTHKKMVTVMKGFRPCTQQELEGELGFICILLGGVPELETYEAQVISSLIQAGSSGSPVFNSDGEIAAVVFAGGGDMSFGMVVPSEYVVEFLKDEVNHLEKQKPNMKVKIGGAEEQGKNRLKNVCLRLELGYISQDKELLNEYCQFFNNDLLK